METKGLDSFYKDYILSLVGVYGLNALITHKLVETCRVVNGRQLYTLLEKKERRIKMKSFKEELELILRRYIPFTGDKDYYDSVVKLVSIKVEELHERYKDK